MDKTFFIVLFASSMSTMAGFGVGCMVHFLTGGTKPNHRFWSLMAGIAMALASLVFHLLNVPALQ